MNNVLPRSLKMHYKYDLKGSTYKRRASRKEREKSCPTYKDLDFVDMHEGLYFDPETYNALMKTLQRDCRVSVHLCFAYLLMLSVINIGCIISLNSVHGYFSRIKKHTVSMVRMSSPYSQAPERHATQNRFSFRVVY